MCDVMTFSSNSRCHFTLMLTTHTFLVRWKIQIRKASKYVFVRLKTRIIDLMLKLNEAKTELIVFYSQFHSIFPHHSECLWGWHHSIYNGTKPRNFLWSQNDLRDPYQQNMPFILYIQLKYISWIRKPPTTHLWIVNSRFHIIRIECCNSLLYYLPHTIRYSWVWAHFPVVAHSKYVCEKSDSSKRHGRVTRVFKARHWLPVIQRIS